MFCTQCGRQIENGTICEDCAKKQELMGNTTFVSEAKDGVTVTATTPPTPVAPAGNKKAGLKKAIIGAVIAFVALIIVSFGTGLLTGAMELAAFGDISIEEYDIMFSISMTISVFGLIACVPAIILGISSIKTFIKEKRETNVKPIATLIVGIFSIVWVAVSVFTFFITLLLSGMMTL